MLMAFKGTEMSRHLVVGLYVAVMIGVIVGLDISVFRNQVLARLLVNIGVVLVFGAFYLRFLRAA